MPKLQASGLGFCVCDMCLWGEFGKVAFKICNFEGKPGRAASWGFRMECGSGCHLMSTQFPGISLKFRSLAAGITSTKDWPCPSTGMFRRFQNHHSPLPASPGIQRLGCLWDCPPEWG